MTFTPDEREALRFSVAAAQQQGATDKGHALKRHILTGSTSAARNSMHALAETMLGRHPSEAEVDVLADAFWSIDS